MGYKPSKEKKSTSFFNTLSSASLKTLSGKPSGIKPWLKEKECRTYLFLILMQTIIFKMMK